MAAEGALNPEQFLGRRWSVITKTNMRYVGLMVDFNMEESTFRLQDGRSCWGGGGCIVPIARLGSQPPTVYSTQ